MRRPQFESLPRSLRVAIAAPTLFLLLFPLLGAAQEAESASPRKTLPIHFAIFAGVQTWSLETLESISSERAAESAAAGFGMQGIEYGWVPAFGADFRIDFREPWFLRLHGEWIRFRADDRGGTVLVEMGRGSRFVSVGYETQVGTRPFIGSVDLGRTFWVGGSPVFLCVGPVLAPIKVTDTFENWIEGTTSIESHQRESTGFGVGVAATLTMGYFVGATDLYLEFFYRDGSTQVEIEDPALERPLLPLRREIEFTGGGFRLGIRF